MMEMKKEGGEMKSKEVGDGGSIGGCGGGVW